MSLSGDALANIVMQALQKNPTVLTSMIASNPAVLSSLLTSQTETSPPFPTVIDLSPSTSPSSSGSQPSRSLSQPSPSTSTSAPAINLFGVQPAAAPVARQSYLDCDVYFTAGQARKRGTNTDERKAFLDRIKEECNKQQVSHICIHSLSF